jgi:formamidopyrimidine-DNA glycosylase
MPELPEVQTVVDELNSENLHGRIVTGVQVCWDKTVALGNRTRFSRELRGRRIQDIRRRGKYIVIDLHGGGHLIFHLRMTGKLYLTQRHARRRPHEHLLIRLDDGRRLTFHDTRKFGRAYLVSDADTILGRLGPEPLSRQFTARMLQFRLNARRRQIKPLLLDQTFVAGLGNIYVDETLWSARIHPRRTALSLMWHEIKVLHRSMRGVLRQGLRNSGTTLGSGKGNFVSPRRNPGRNHSALKVFRRTGQACPRCGNPIDRIIVAQRSTHYCRQCQKESDL